MATNVQRPESGAQLFSYHLIEAPFGSIAARLLFSSRLRKVPGLIHGECLLHMNMGAPVGSPGRYRWNSLVFFGFWASEAALEAFLQSPPYGVFGGSAWHLRMRFYRRWGSYTGLHDAVPQRELAEPSGPVAAVTLARLRLSQTLRFTRWGKPVEAQVRDSPGLMHGAVSFRPMNVFSTFSIWESEAAMLAMVRGKRGAGAEHRDAMVERAQRPFHHEFTTMRFVPVSEHGVWPGTPRLTGG